MKRTPTNEILSELALFSLESAEQGRQYKYTDEDVDNILLILQEMLSNRLWMLCENVGLPQDKRENIAAQMGNELRDFLIKYIDFDPHKYDENKD